MNVQHHPSGRRWRTARARNLIAGCCAGLVATVTGPHAARADEGAAAEPVQPTGDVAAAEALFNEARRLLAAGDYKAACPKFAESYRLDPVLGALLNLAVCHEREGKLATAWTEYREGEAKARAAKDAKWEKWAADKAAALDKRLPKLAVTVVDPAEGIEVKRDKVLLAEGSFSFALPVDPGWHEVVARAPGRIPWSKRFKLEEGEQLELKIPRLRRAATGESGTDDWKNSTPDWDTNPIEPTKSARKDEPAVSSGKTTAGFVVTGLGVASLAVGGVFVKLVADKKAAADENCPEKLCNAEGADAIGSARGLAWGANIALGLGAVGLVAGGYLLLSGDPPAASDAAKSSTTRSRKRRVTVALDPMVSPSGAFLRGRMRF